MVLPKERAVVSLWVNPCVQLNPLSLLTNALVPLGRTDLGTGAGFSKPWKPTGPSKASGAMRTGANFGDAILPAGSVSDCDRPSAGAVGIPTFWNCTFCLPLFRCASANGIAQTARSVRRISALQRRCALIEEFCFFIVLSLSSFGRIHGSNPLCVHRGEHTCSEKDERASRFFLHFFQENSRAPKAGVRCRRSARMLHDSTGKFGDTSCRFYRGNVRFGEGNSGLQGGVFSFQGAVSGARFCFAKLWECGASSRRFPSVATLAQKRCEDASHS